MKKNFIFIIFIIFLLFNSGNTCKIKKKQNARHLYEGDIFRRLFHELDLSVIPNISRNDFQILDEDFDTSEKNEILGKKTLEGTGLTIGSVSEEIIHFKTPESISDKVVENGKLVISSLILNFDYDVIDLKIFHVLKNGTWKEMIGDKRYTFEEIIEGNKIEIPIFNDEMSRLTSLYKDFDLEVSGTPYNYNDDDYLLPSDEIIFKMTNNNPYIVYKSFTIHKERKIRSEYKTCDGDINDSSCCLKSYKLDVSKPPWNFIISPSILDIKSCVGSCVKNDRATANSNFVRYSEDSEYKSCCYASEFETIKVLYATDNFGTLQFKNITNLIAKTCSCY